MSDGRGDMPTGPVEWAGRFEQQAAACDDLGSPLWGRLLRLIAADVASQGPSWSVVVQRADLRFGQAGPLRLAGAAHRLALAGAAPEWAALLPSCGGVAPSVGRAGDDELRRAWFDLIEDHRDELVSGLDREVQTNEVARSAALAYAHAVVLGRVGSGRGRDGGGSVRLVEIGCSGGLNLRLDRFRIDLTDAPGGGVLLGDPDGRVRLAPEVRCPIDPVLERAVGSAVGRAVESAVEPGSVTAAHPVSIVERIGIDPHPIDPSTADGRLALLSFVWPDQSERFERLVAAIELAREVPTDLMSVGAVRGSGAAGRSGTTAEVLDEVLSRPVGSGVATVVQHSIVWQYIPTDQRPEVTAAIERAGERATGDEPLVWVRVEPDEWDRRRAAVHVRRWPDGGDRLVAHADFHGRWLAPVGLT